MVIVLEGNKGQKSRAENHRKYQICEKFPLGARDQGLNLISDNGSQPTSVMKDTTVLGINHILFFYDYPKGNAEIEREVRTIKEEFLWLNDFSFYGEARDAIEHWIIITTHAMCI